MQTPLRTAVFLSPHQILNPKAPKAADGGTPPFPGPLYRKIMGKMSAEILSGRVDLFRSGPAVVAMLEHDLKMSLHEVERLVVLLSGQHGLDVITPIIRSLPSEKVIWLVCQCGMRDGVDKMIRHVTLAERGAEQTAVVCPVNHCTASQKFGVMIDAWLEGTELLVPA